MEQTSSTCPLNGPSLQARWIRAAVTRATLHKLGSRQQAALQKHRQCSNVALPEAAAVDTATENLRCTWAVFVKHDPRNPSALSHRIGRLTGETISWFHRERRLSNQHCLYCGAALGLGATTKSDKEHWIGRNFVPTGTMGNQAFNFLFRACTECNARKAVAERHISSVTLINGPGRHEDTRAAAVAGRKEARDFHPDKPGVAMGKSHDHHSINLALGAASISIRLVSPPRANHDAVIELALNHVQALFSLITSEDYLDAAKMRLLPARQVVVFGAYGRSDWGNPRLVELSKRVQAWECLANVTSADGYFRATMRRHEIQGWFWALEWNKFLRVVGAIVGNQIPLFENLPDEEWRLMPDGKRRFKAEMPLADGDDVLFASTVDTSAT